MEQRQCARGGNRSCRQEFLATEIDAHLQAFESVRAKQDHVAGVGKDDNRRRRSPSGVEQGETHFPLEYAAGGGLESVDAHGIACEHATRSGRALSPKCDQTRRSTSTEAGWLGREAR